MRLSKQPPGANVLQCSVCCGTFSRKHNLQRHIQSSGHRSAPPVTPFIKEVLPKQWKFSVWKFEDKGKVDGCDRDGYHLKVACDEINDVDGIKEFIRMFGEQNDCEYRLQHTQHTKTSQTRDYFCVYKCQHCLPAKREKLSRKKRFFKGTGCKSSIAISVKKKHDNDEKYCVFDIKFEHNHPLTSAEVLRYRIPSENVKNIFRTMFENNLGPADALRAYKTHIRLQSNPDDEENYLLQMSNRKIVPDYDWVRHYYRSLHDKKFTPGSSKAAEAIQCLQKYIETLPEKCCFLKHLAQIENTPSDFAIVVLTPFMRRMLSTKNASEMILIDSWGSVDKFGLRIFSIMTKMPAGEMPLGVIITTSETTNAIVESFQFYFSLINPELFAGRGQAGPILVIFDDLASQNAAFRVIFPQSRHLLCTSNLLQSCHWWILKNISCDTEMSSVYAALRGMIYANTEAIFETKYLDFLSTFSTNKALVKYIKGLYERKEMWALCYRNNDLMMTRAIDTNDIVQRGTRFLKENILKRLRAQSPSELVDFIAKDYSCYFEENLLNCARGCLNNRSQKVDSLSPDNYVFSVGDFNFMYNVLNKKKNLSYKINTDIGVCSCFIGFGGFLCKHQELLAEVLPTLRRISAPPPDTRTKQELYFLATGSTNLSEELARPPVLESELGGSSSDQIGFETSEDISLEDNIESSPVRNEYETEAEDREFPVEPVDEPISEEDQQASKDEIEMLMSNIEMLKSRLRANPAYFCDALRSFNKELEVLLKGPSSKLLAALYSFGKTPKPRMKLIKRIGRNSVAISHR